MKWWRSWFFQVSGGDEASKNHRIPLHILLWYYHSYTLWLGVHLHLEKYFNKSHRHIYGYDRRKYSFNTNFFGDGRKITIYPWIDITLSTVNKYNSKLLAFNRIFKCHYYMLQSTEISTFNSPDYVFYLVLIISSPLCLFLRSLSISRLLLLPLPVGRHTNQKLEWKMARIKARQKPYRQKPNAQKNAAWKTRSD